MEKKQNPRFVQLPWDQTVNVAEVVVFWKEDRGDDPSIGVTMKSGNVQRPPKNFFESAKERDLAYKRLYEEIRGVSNE